MIKLSPPNKNKESTFNFFTESDFDVDSGSKFHSAIDFKTESSTEVDLFSTSRRDCQ